MREAQQEHLTRWMREIQSVRIAMSDRKEYEPVIVELKKKIEMLEKGHDEVVRQDWEDLIRQGQGR